MCYLPFSPKGFQSIENVQKAARTAIAVPCFSESFKISQGQDVAISSPGMNYPGAQKITKSDQIMLPISGYPCQDGAVSGDLTSWKRHWTTFRTQGTGCCCRTTCHKRPKVISRMPMLRIHRHL